MGHNSIIPEHAIQNIKWPHGRKIIPRSRSKQTLHSFSSCMVTRSSSSAKSAASAKDLSFGTLSLITFKIESFCALAWFAVARNSNNRTRSCVCFMAFLLACRIVSNPAVSMLSSLRMTWVSSSSNEMYSRFALTPWKVVTRVASSPITLNIISSIFIRAPEFVSTWNNEDEDYLRFCSRNTRAVPKCCFTIGENGWISSSPNCGLSVTFSKYEGHSETIDTSLAFWTLDEIKNSAYSTVKREDWTGREKEKVGQLCPGTETGAVESWAMVDSWCQLNPFHQAINDCIIR